VTPCPGPLDRKPYPLALRQKDNDGAIERRLIVVRASEVDVRIGSAADL
jgi:hypothetical protein